MRVYIQQDAGDMTAYYPLHSFEMLVIHRNGNQSWIKAAFPNVERNPPSFSLVENIDEATATQAMDELLSLTEPSEAGAVVISWDGSHFTRRSL
ncbi:hypothetical protein DBR22_09845 [Arthrobacter sp. HMWF013]|nr:hypothetical protein DBR22_09845 [Arthrobacter sp. HMWF013]